MPLQAQATAIAIATTDRPLFTPAAAMFAASALSPLSPLPPLPPLSPAVSTDTADTAAARADGLLAAASSQRFLIIDDHPMVRDSMHTLLQSILPGCSTTLAIDLQQMRSIVATGEPFDYAIVDLTLPDGRGIGVLRAIHDIRPALPLIVYSARVEQEIILRCLNFGVVGYIPKTLYNDLAAQALRLIFSGQVYVPSQAVSDARTDNYSVSSMGRVATSPRDLGLTERQIDVLYLMLRGLPNKLICRELNLAEGTVKVHVSAVLRALGVRNRTQAVIAAREIGLTDEY